MQSLLYLILTTFPFIYICQHISIPCSHFMNSWMFFMKSKPTKELYVQLIDLESPITVISTNSAETLKLTEMNLQTETLQATLVNETLSIGENYTIDIPNVLYYAIKKQFRKHKKTDSYSAFSLGISNYNFSLTHLLKEQHMIDRIIFSIEFYNSTNDGVLYFGSLPLSVTTKYKYKGNIKIIEQNDNNNNSLWQFNLNFVKVNDNVYHMKVNESKGNSFFRSNDKNILIPSLYYYSILNNLIGNSIKDESCKFHSQYEQYICECDEMNIIGNMTLGVNGIEFVVEGKRLFKGSDFYCMLLIKENTLGNEWVFGTAFMEAFLISFDYHTREVTLYSNNISNDKCIINENINNKHKHKFYIKHICIIEIITVTLFSFILLREIISNKTIL